MNSKLRQRLVDMYANEIGFCVVIDEDTETAETISDDKMIVELLEHLVSGLREQKDHTHSIGRGGY